jgi:hypothetical protein
VLGAALSAVLGAAFGTSFIVVAFGTGCWPTFCLFFREPLFDFRMIYISINTGYILIIKKMKQCKCNAHGYARAHASFIFL